MTVVLAQTVLPRHTDFGDVGATLSDPEYRRRHRRHLSEVLGLLKRTLQARATYGPETAADLIIFPELCVHVDDLWIVERLIDQWRVADCGQRAAEEVTARLIANPSPMRTRACRLFTR